MPMLNAMFNSMRRRASESVPDQGSPHNPVGSPDIVVQHERYLRLTDPIIGQVPAATDGDLPNGIDIRHRPVTLIEG